MVCWPWHEKKWDFPAKIDRSLSTHLPSQSVDCVGWASCIQGPKSRKNQAEWHRSLQRVNADRKEWIHWVKLGSLLYRKVQCGPQSVQSPGSCSLFFQRFVRSSYWSISSCWSTAVFRRDHSLLLGIGVQLVVSCTAIEAQIVFETLFALVTGQLAVAGQLRREVHP